MRREHPPNTLLFIRSILSKSHVITISANQSRGTPGLLLLIFACALLLTAAGARVWRRDAHGPTEVVARTGLGDAKYYTALSDNDFTQPALVFSQATDGLFR